MNQSIVKASLDIREQLKKRFKELNLSQTEICAIGRGYGRKMTKARLSNYINNKDTIMSLKEEDIVFLCLLYCININLVVKPLEYNEAQGIKNVKKFFKV